MRKELITLQSNLKEKYREIERLYKANYKASYIDENSGSYDSMQRLSGQLLAIEYALIQLSDTMFKIKQRDKLRGNK